MSSSLRGHLPGRRIPASLAAVVRKAMALDRAARYADVPALQADIQAYQNGFATKAEHAGLVTLLRLLIRRHKTASAAAAVILALTAAFTAKVVAEGRRAEAALANLQRTAPTLVAEGRKLIDAQKFDDALAKIRFAVEIEPRNAESHLLLAQLQQARLELREAADEFRRVLALGPHASAQENLALCEKLLRDYPSADAFDRAAYQRLYEQMEKEGRSTQAAPIAVKLGRSRQAAEALLQSRLAVWRQIHGWDRKPEKERWRWEGDGTLSLFLEYVLIDDLSTLSGLPVSRLNISFTRVSDLRPVAGMRLRMIHVIGLKKLADLSPLKGMSLVEFQGGANDALSDLSPLAGMKLTRFEGGGGKLRDLAPLKGMPLKLLVVTDSPIAHLNDLAGAPIETLNMTGARGLTDISAVRTMRLKTAHFAKCTELRDFTPLLDCPALEKVSVPRDIKEVEVLRRYAGLKELGYENQTLKPAEFWAEFDALWKTKDEDAKVWAKFRAAFAAAGLPAPDTNIVRRREDGTYSIELHFLGEKMKKIPDLRGLPVSEIKLSRCPVTDLSPLAGVSVRILRLDYISAPDLTPLRACPQLEVLDLSFCAQLRDLSPLAGMKLRSLRVGVTKVRDISVVAGMPLREFVCNQTEVTDLRPLLSCPDLESLCLSAKATNVGELRSLKKLKRLSTKWDGGFAGPAQTAEEFWKEYDAAKK